MRAEAASSSRPSGEQTLWQTHRRSDRHNGESTAPLSRRQTHGYGEDARAAGATLQGVADSTRLEMNETRRGRRAPLGQTERREENRQLTLFEWLGC